MLLPNTVNIEFNMRQIFLDTETTGLLADQGDRVIEIGCVEMVNRKLTGRHFHYYLQPDRESHEDALRIHGLTSQFLADKPRFKEIAEAFTLFVQDAEIIIHNAPFDQSFLNAELARTGLPPLKDHVHRIVDSLAMAKEMWPGKRNSLDALCDRLEVDNTNRSLHGALLDAQLLAHVYINMTRGQNSLMMDSQSPTAGSAAVAAIDFSTLNLTVIKASDQELAAHEAVLQELDKASNTKTVWRQTAQV